MNLTSRMDLNTVAGPRDPVNGPPLLGRGKDSKEAYETEWAEEDALQRVFGLTDWVRDGTLAEFVAVEARNLAPLPARGQSLGT